MTRTRCFFAAVILLVFIFCCSTIYMGWIVPRARGASTQAMRDRYILSSGLNGHAIAIFYLERVRIVGDDFGLNEVLNLEQIVRDSGWVKLVDVGEANISASELEILKRRFSPIVVIDD